MERPYTFINSAMSADGKISTKKRKQVKISGRMDFERVDELRATSDAVMVGIGTVLADDPSLTVKSEERRKRRVAQGKDENPVRIVVDSKARTPLNADIFNKGVGKRIVVVSKAAPEDKVKALMEKAEVLVAGDGEVDLAEMCRELKRRGIERLMVEGGATLNWAMVRAGLVDEISVFIGNLIIGGKEAPTFMDGEGISDRDEAIKLELMKFERMDEGIVLTWRVIYNNLMPTSG
ncbi:2,5-diamino-6-(5-phosphoribosylamino)pyrimidin- 4(3H)-one reductase [Methanocella conradii HZ254]|uniref:2,5-diamino-6-(ribosylamino)-4(3H)-pyrimidinone 5'-phosphate reductase n=1 Tax=Methanocella conradii (strain DSM 24694 / JCM 17849 / CGMCC 1.5162 / HZ254) TaxID=1041930 RepID=H8I786_METCZ|nr:2,5-diamino-6-(ribosylamino)-4(3H)-pyrimidinone 5'-phosphate reductase [Methanocella conradii]AFD00337.1 2,5-diamino-6-(5-phosphoribosylamino)pyrimidin- 4(3H)-one reductase [Methanocella conradii HZ254]